MSSTFTCPKGHLSADNDFCSECGSKIQGAAPIVPVNDSVGAGKICPDCRAPVPPAGVNFCEICGYNFATQTSGQFPLPVEQATPAPLPITAVATGFKIVVAIDATLRTPNSPEAPTDFPPIAYPLDKPVSLVGRKSDARAIFPEIPLDADSAVSHRHGLISQTPDGLLIYRDLGSSNGTRLNGTELTPLLDSPLKAGDQLTLGHWTRITVEPNS
jgi:hypothetical protein